MSTGPIATGYIRLLPDASQFQAAGVAALRAPMAGLQTDANRMAGALGRATTEAGDFRRGMFAASLSVAGLRGAVLAAGSSFLVGAGLIRGMELFIGLSAEFQRSMNQFQAVTHATTGEMRAARAEAIALGNDIKLPSTSASDAAVAMTELARGGLSVTESMNAARGALTLATAASTDFATAAQIQARVLQSFALAGDQATHVADVLANSANISTGEITDMAFALRQSSAVAHQAGLSLSETAAALTEMGNAGLVGSDAGTSLRTMLLRLNPTTTKAKELMQDLGIVTTDAAGQFLPFTEVIRRYQRVLERLTPAQRQQALMTLFGQDAIRAATIIFGEGAREFDRNREAVDRQGAAAELAAAKNKGLTGTFDALRSNLQSTAINIGQSLLPAVTSFVGGVNEMFTSLTKSGQAAQTLRTFGIAGGEVIRATGQAAADAAAPVLLFAKGLAAVANVVGGTGLGAFIIGLKGTQLLLPRIASGTERLAKAQAVLSGEMLLTNRRGLQVKTGLTTLQTAMQRLGTEAGRMQMAREWENLARATANATTAEEGYARVLTGSIAVQGRAVQEAQALAVARTKATAGQIGSARQAEQLAQFAAQQAAVARAGGRPRDIFGRFQTRQAAIDAGLLTRAWADTEREGLQLSLQSERLGSRLRTLGSSIVGFVGGPLTAWAIGIGALLVIYTKFIRKVDDSEAVFQRAAQNAQTTSSDMLDAQNRLTSLRSSIKADELAVEQQRLNISIAQGAIETAQLSGNSDDLRAANLQLKEAQLGLSDATQRVTDDLQQQGIEQARVSALARQNAQDIEALAEANLKLFQRAQGPGFAGEGTIAQLREITTEFFANPLTSKGSAWNLIQTGIRRTFQEQENYNQAVQKSIQALRRERDALVVLDPVRAHSLDLIAEYEARTNSVNKRVAETILLQNRSATGTFKVGTLLLGETKARREVLTSVEAGRAAVISGVDELSPILQRMGTKNAEAWARGIAIGILTSKGGLITLWRRQLAEMEAQGQQQIQQSIVAAQNNMLSIASNLDQQIAQIIDAGPLGQEIDKLQARLDLLRHTGERIKLLRDLADANRTLARRRESLDPLASTHLTPAEAQARARGVKDFLRPAIQARDDAERAIKEFNIQSIIDNLNKAREAQKKAVVHGIADVVAAFAAGRIKASTAIQRLAAIIGNVEHSRMFKAAGNTLGISFVEGFKAAARDLIAQIRELAKPEVAAATAPGFPGPGVQTPSTTIREVHDRIVIARAQEQLKEQKAINQTTQKIYNKLAAGVTKDRAVRTVRIQANVVVLKEKGIR